MQLAAIIVSLVLIVVGVALFARALLQIYTFMRLGQNVPTGTRTDEPVQRTVTVAKEFLGHTRMNRWGIVGVAHWFVAVGFFSLLLTIVNAVGQLFQADWLLPIVGEWAPYNVFVEFIGTMTVLGIVVLIVIRQLSRPDKPGRKSASRAPTSARRTSSRPSSSSSASASSCSTPSKAPSTTWTATRRRSSSRTRWSPGSRAWTSPRSRTSPTSSPG